MTECERLQTNGDIPSSFFMPETRCGFEVTNDRKKIWAIELDLLKQFQSVCKKFGLTYFLFDGSLLGAVRHKGFIPWDDDLDVAMPRDDYERLLSLGNEFSAPYFLQSPWTDNGYFYSFAKLRNSNTSFVSRQFRFERFNQGIMIDIFPIDGWNPQDDKASWIFEEINRLAYDNSTYMRMRNPDLSEEDRHRVRVYAGGDPFSACVKMRDLGMTYHDDVNDFVCRNAIGLYGYARNVFRKEDFASTVEMDFEGLSKVSVPVGYDRILKVIYGDYMQLPPLEERGQWHSFAIVDPDVPYVENIKR